MVKLRKVFITLRKSNQIKFLFFIFLFSFILRIGFLVFYSGDSSYGGINSIPWSSADDGRYEKVASSLTKSGLSGLLEDLPILQGHPLYPLFLAVIYSFFGHHYFIVRLVQVLLSSITCILIFFIGKNIFNRRVGILASIYSSIYPMFIYFNGRFLTETLFIFLLSISVLFLTKIHKEPTPRNSILTGIFLGFCILTRSMFLGFIPLVIIWVFTILKEKKQIVVISSYIIISVVIITMPWIMGNVVVKSPASQGVGHVLWIWNNPYTDGGHYIPSQEVKNNDKYKELALSLEKNDREVMKLALNYIKQNPAQFLKGIWYRFIRFWHFDSKSIRPSEHSRYRLVGFLSYGLLLPFIILGIYISFKEWRKPFMLYLLIFYFTLVCSILSSGVRKRAPIDPYLIMFGMLSIDYLINKFPLLSKIRKLYEFDESNGS